MEKQQFIKKLEQADFIIHSFYRGSSISFNCYHEENDESIEGISHPMCRYMPLETEVPFEIQSIFLFNYLFASIKNKVLNVSEC